MIYAMKYAFVLLIIGAIGCTGNDNSRQSRSDHAQSTKARTLLNKNTLYYYRSAFTEFQDRLKWIAITNPVQYRDEVNKIKRTRAEYKDIMINILTSNRFALIYNMFNETHDENGKRKTPSWVEPWGAITDAPIENSFERSVRSLPKLNGDGVWDLKEIETIPFDLDDPAKKIFIEMAKYNIAGKSKMEHDQSQARVVATSTALIFRESDNSVLFINGIKWNHPLYANGYTEYHLHISQTTGAVINDAYVYTTFPLEPGVFDQYKAIAQATIDAIIVIKGIIGR